MYTLKIIDENTLLLIENKGAGISVEKWRKNGDNYFLSGTLFIEEANNIYHVCDENTFILSKRLPDNTLDFILYNESDKSKKNIISGIDYHYDLHNLKNGCFHFSEDVGNQKKIISYNIFDQQKKTLFEYPKDQILEYISDDEKYIGFIKFKGDDSTENLIYDISANREILVMQDESLKFIQFIHEDKVYYITDKDHDYTYLAALNLKNNNVEKKLLFNGRAILSATLQNKNLICKVNTGFELYYEVYDFKSLKQYILPHEFDKSNIFSNDINGNILGIVGLSYQTLGKIIVYNVNDKKHYTIKENVNGDTNYSVDFVHYRSFDKQKIPSILFMPKGDDRYPAIIFLHGGPGSMIRDFFDPLIDALCKNGIVVLAINYRGSIGFGRKLFTAVNKRTGVDDVKDCIYAKKYLEQLDQIDKEKIGIIGVSYGGYLSILSIIQSPDAFRCCIDLSGVVDMVEQIKYEIDTFPHATKESYKQLYGDLENPDDFHRIDSLSPINNISRILTPLLVVHGKNDRNVKFGQVNRFLDLFSKMGKNNLESLLFEDEGHGIISIENKNKLHKAILDFCKMHLT